MPYSATVLTVMIASPGDLPEGRQAVADAVHSWNSDHAEDRQVVLVPWGWEQSVPLLGRRAQEILNEQGVARADILVAPFRHKLGTSTGDSPSGTAEEIKEAAGRGLKVHVYFSDEPIPSDADLEQVAALREFKQELGRGDRPDGGLYKTFSSPESLREKVKSALTHDVIALGIGAPEPSATSASPTGVKFLVQPGELEEPNGFSKAGKPKYTTRHWVDVTNQGDQKAEDVRVTNALDEDETDMIRLEGDGPTTIAAGQKRPYKFMVVWSGETRRAIRINWTENGEPHEEDFDIN